MIAPTALVFQKTVANVTSGANPAAEARPGDRLRYRLQLENQADFALSGLTLRDEIDRLNTDPAFQPGTLTRDHGAGRRQCEQHERHRRRERHGRARRAQSDARTVGRHRESSSSRCTLAPVIANGTDVLNQSQLLAGGDAVIAQSDDPNINGADDPNVAGDEDPTRIRIVSAPAFRVQKISTDMTGDPTVLLAGRNAALHDHGQEHRHLGRDGRRGSATRFRSTRVTWRAARR